MVRRRLRLLGELKKAHSRLKQWEAHKTNRPEPEIAKSSTDAHTLRWNISVGEKAAAERKISCSFQPFLCVHVRSRKYICVLACSRWCFEAHDVPRKHYFPLFSSLRQRYDINKLFTAARLVMQNAKALPDDCGCLCDGAARICICMICIRRRCSCGGHIILLLMTSVAPGLWSTSAARSQLTADITVIYVGIPPQWNISVLCAMVVF